MTSTRTIQIVMITAFVAGTLTLAGCGSSEHVTKTTTTEQTTTQPLTGATQTTTTSVTHEKEP